MTVYERYSGEGLHLEGFLVLVIKSVPKTRSVGSYRRVNWNGTGACRIDQHSAANGLIEMERNSAVITDRGTEHRCVPVRLHGMGGDPERDGVAVREGLHGV